MVGYISRYISRCKAFLTVYLGIMGFHLIEEGFWITLARFTETPIWTLYLGTVLLPLGVTVFVRKYHKHEHAS